MDQSYYLKLIGRQLAGELPPAEARELQAWVEADPANRAFYDEITRLWKASEAYELPAFEADTEQAWSSLERRLGPGGAKVIGLNRWLRYAAAVLVLLIAGYGAFTALFDTAEAPVASYLATLQTAEGEQRRIPLPDGSVVVLNQRSTLRYDTVFTERSVTLEGEAFFDVARDESRPFLIHTQEAKTKVLGTAFNVRAYPEEAEIAVSVEEGKVQVAKSANASEAVVLAAGQSGVYRKSEDQLAKAELTNALAWKTQELRFDGTRLQRVAEDMERYFGVTIEIDNRQLQECRFKGTFKQPELEALLDIIAYTMDLQVEERNGRYTLNGAAKCN